MSKQTWFEFLASKERKQKQKQKRKQTQTRRGTKKIRVLVGGKYVGKTIWVNIPESEAQVRITMAKDHSALLKKLEGQGKKFAVSGQGRPRVVSVYELLKAAKKSAGSKVLSRQEFLKSLEPKTGAARARKDWIKKEKKN